MQLYKGSGSPKKGNTLPAGNEKILFVDDEEVMLDVGKRMLERLGYSVTVTTNALEALEMFLLDKNFFDLVITDFSMPQLTGIELANKMLAIRPTLPIILFTGYSELIMPDKVGAAGIKELITKPIGQKELAVCIRRVLDNALQIAKQNCST